MEVSSPTIIVERAGSYAWMHKSWRVREEFARTVTSATGLFASTELPLQRVILAPILQMLNDPNQAVREAAILCIEEMYMKGGSQFREELQRHHLPSYMVKDIDARLERITPSCAGFTDSERLIGAAAKNQAAVNPGKYLKKTLMIDICETVVDGPMIEEYSSEEGMTSLQHHQPTTSMPRRSHSGKRQHSRN